MEWRTTSAILERLHDAGDDEMWAVFHERFRPPLLGFAHKLGLTGDAAEDVAQESLMAFAKGYREGKYDPGRGRLSSWLFGIAYRQAAAALRKRVREQRKQDARAGHTSFWGKVPDQADATSTWDDEWRRAAVQQCLGQLRAELNESSYRAFHAVVYEDRAPDEVAVELGMTRNAVYIAKHRALKRLGELVRQFSELAS